MHLFFFFLTLLFIHTSPSAFQMRPPQLTLLNRCCEDFPGVLITTAAVPQPGTQSHFQHFQAKAGAKNKTAGSPHIRQGFLVTGAAAALKGGRKSSGSIWKLPCCGQNGWGSLKSWNEGRQQLARDGTGSRERESRVSEVTRSLESCHRFEIGSCPSSEKNVPSDLEERGG